MGKQNPPVACIGGVNLGGMKAGGLNGGRRSDIRGLSARPLCRGEKPVLDEVMEDEDDKGPIDDVLRLPDAPDFLSPGKLKKLF